MPPPLMQLKILLPFQIFAEQPDVSRLVVETQQGSVGLLPRRRDCVLALVPGLLIYETEAQGEAYLAVDRGVLIKAGAEVLVSVRRALRGTELAALRDAVDEEFTALDEQEQGVRAVMAKLEAGVLKRLVDLHHA